ncbi:hypothetical protein ACWDUE_13955 [Streptomyces albogriseolus]
MELNPDARQRAEALLREHVEYGGANWHPAGYVLIIERLDRLVTLAERLCSAERAK